MFEYVNPKREHDADAIKSKVITVIITLVGAAGIFAVLYYAAKAG